MGSPEGMVGVDGDSCAQGVAVIEDDGRASGRKVLGGVAESPGHHKGRVAKEAAKQVNVVNAVVKDFKAGMILEKWEEMPRRVNPHADFRVVKLAKMPLFHEPARGDHKKSKAKPEH